MIDIEILEILPHTLQIVEDARDWLHCVRMRFTLQKATASFFIPLPISLYSFKGYNVFKAIFVNGQVNCVWTGVDVAYSTPVSVNRLYVQGTGVLNLLELEQ
jgi:hypothetical protein